MKNIKFKNELCFTSIIADSPVRKTISFENEKLNKSSVGLSSGIAKTMAMPPLDFASYLEKIQDLEVCISTSINHRCGTEHYELVPQSKGSVRGQVRF